MGAHDEPHTRNAILSACAAVITAFVLGVAPPAAWSQSQIAGPCLDDLFNKFTGGSVNCTANDIQIAAVTDVTVTDDGCAFAGDTVTFDATLQVLLTAQDRHDIGVFLAQDGGDALTGSCFITTLPYEPSNENCTAANTPYACCNGSGTGTCEFVDLDQTGDTGQGCSNDNSQPCTTNAHCPGGTCITLGPGTQDLCGDITNDSRNPIFHQITGLTVLCIDSDNDGFLDVTAATSWRQSGANELCLSPLYAYPGAPSKCRVDTTLALPITVPKTINVCKELVLANDPGLFDLQIDGTTERTDATDGDCTGPVAVEGGVRFVSELAGSGTTLTAYTTDIACVDQVGRCTLDNTIHCIVDAVCNAANPGDTCDLTPTQVASCTNCTSVMVTVDPVQASDIVCTITNTNDCTTTVCNGPTGPCDGGEVCDPTIGACAPLPETPASTPCPDTDGNDCTTAGCDGAGSCDQDHLFVPDSTPCADLDGDACTTAGCDGFGTCDQSHVVTTCPGGSGSCGAGEACNPATGDCEPLPVAPASTPCPDTDGNDCTTAGCDGAGNCDQDHIFAPDSTPCTDVDGDACTTAGCNGAGSCDQNHVVLQCPVGICDTGACDAQTGECIPLSSGTSCNTDDDLCTVEECDGAGQCVFQSDVSCPGSTGPCDGGEQCNPATGACDPLPDTPANTPCPDTDGNGCTIAACDGVGGCSQSQILQPSSTPCLDNDGDACTTAGCDGFGTCDQNHLEKSCPVDICDSGTCDAQTGECIPLPVSTPCEVDGDPCTTDHCNGAGLCVFLENVSCPGPTGPCDGGEQCNDQTGLCDPLPDLPVDTPCDADGDQCTIDQCDGNGGCVFQSDVACQPPSPPCEGGELCNPATGACDPEPDAPASTPCEADGDQCTIDRCDGLGSCLLQSTLTCQPPNPPCEGGEVCNPATGACDPEPDAPASTPCPDTDDRACTLAACDGAGSCEQEYSLADAGTPCEETDDNRCTVAGCDGAGICNQTYGFADEGTPCDIDGDLCTVDRCLANGVCEPTQEQGPTAPFSGDQYKCYKTRQVGGLFEPRTVTLADQFVTTNATVKRPVQFCNPAESNGDTIADPTAHISCYKIRDESFERRTVTVADRFGELSLTVKRPYSLCLPAEKDAIPSALNINHFKCYVVGKPRGAARFSEVQVTLGDQFEEKQTRVLKPKLLCTPVNKNGEGIVSAEGHLTCYKVKDVPGQPRFDRRAVSFMDQFAQRELDAIRGDCRKSSYLCVPSTKCIASPSGAFLDITSNVLD